MLPCRSLSVTLLIISCALTVRAVDAPPQEPADPADSGQGRTNPELQRVDTFTPATPPNVSPLFSDATQAQLDAARIQVTSAGPSVPVRGTPGSIATAGTAQTKGQAITPNQLDVINTEMLKLSALLDSSLMGNFADGSPNVKAQVIKRGLQKSSELGVRVNSALVPAVDSSGNLIATGTGPAVSPLAEVELLGGWGFRGHSEIRPTEPEKYPEYISIGEMQRYGDEETKKVNKFLDKAENFLSKKMGLGGCSAFDFASEFTALFNRETLKNLVKNLKEGVIAAAPMAILQAISPELANLVQHLKAMASIALQVANGNCETAKAALQPALEKMFNGPDFNRCVEDQKSAGVPFEHAKRACSDQRRFTQATSFLGFNSDPINSGGLWLNDNLGALSDATSGRKSFSDSLAERESAGVAATNMASYQTQTRAKAAEARLADAEMDALLAAPGSLDEFGVPTDATNDQLEIITRRRELARADAAAAAMNAATSRDIYADATMKGCVGDPCQTTQRVLRAGNAADLATLQAERASFNTSYRAWDNLPPDQKATTPKPDLGAQLQAAGLSAKADPQTASLGQQLRDGATAGLNTADGIWDARGDAPILGPFLDAGGDFIANYAGEIFSMPQMRVGLEVGNYSFAWTFQKVRHHAMELSWDIDNGLTNLWKLRKACDRTFDDSLVAVLAITYGVSERPWVTHRAIRAGLYTSSLDASMKNHAFAYMNATTVLKLARLSYRYTHQDDIPYLTDEAKKALSGIVLSSGFPGPGDVKPIGLKEAVDAIANAAVAVYLLDVATDDSVMRQVAEIKKKIDAAYAGDAAQAKAKKEEVEQIQKQMIASVASYVDAVVPVLIAINGTEINTNVNCVSGAGATLIDPLRITVPLDTESDLIE